MGSFGNSGRLAQIKIQANLITKDSFLPLIFLDSLAVFMVTGLLSVSSGGQLNKPQA